MSRQIDLLAKVEHFIEAELQVEVSAFEEMGPVADKLEGDLRHAIHRAIAYGRLQALRAVRHELRNADAVGYEVGRLRGLAEERARCLKIITEASELVDIQDPQATLSNAVEAVEAGELSGPQVPAEVRGA
ncbi:MAG: hypothetical protein AAFU79_36005 [Myxococcota bacterium]